MDNINKYIVVETAIKVVLDNLYYRSRNGFPTKEQWINNELRYFKKNNPELFGLTYDKANGDWLYEWENGFHRVIL